MKHNLINETSRAYFLLYMWNVSRFLIISTSMQCYILWPSKCPRPIVMAQNLICNTIASGWLNDSSIDRVFFDPTLPPCLPTVICSSLTKHASSSQISKMPTPCRFLIDSLIISWPQRSDTLLSSTDTDLTHPSDILLSLTEPYPPITRAVYG